MALTKFPINNFRGGLNTRDNPFELTPNESPDLLNMTITSLVGTLRTRDGKTRYSLSGLAFPNEKIDFMKQVVVGPSAEPPTNRFLMMSINGSVYAMKGNPEGEVIKVWKGTAGTIWDFEVMADAAYKDWVYMSNGVDAPKKWDGVAAEAIAWPVTLGALPNGGVLCMWENRMMISYVTGKGQRVFFSEFSDPEATIKEYGFVDVRSGGDDLDTVQDLAVLGARLFVLRRRDVFFISSPVTMLNRRIGSPGVFSRFQVAEMEDKLYWFNQQGIWSTGGVAVTMESGSINNWFPANLATSFLFNARLMVTRDTYPRLLLAVPTGSNTGNDMLIEMIPHINFRRIGGRRYLLLPAFMIHNLACDSLAAWNPSGTVEQVVAATNAEKAQLSSITVRDNFFRANEEPLTGVKWLVLPGLTHKGRVQSNAWEPEPSSPQEQGALWNEGKANPSVGVEIVQVGTGYLNLWLENTSNRYKLEILGEQWYLWAIPTTSTTAKTRIIATARQAIAAGDKVFLASHQGNTLTAWIEHEGIWERVAWAKDNTNAIALGAGTLQGFSSQTLTGGTPWRIGEFYNGPEALETTIKTLVLLFNGTTDEGNPTPVHAHWRSAWFPLQEGENRERIRRLDVQLSGSAFLDVYTDFEELPRFQQELPFLGEAKEFDEPKALAGPEAYRFARVRPETYGRYHAIRFSTRAQVPFTINTAEMVYRGGKQH